MKDKIILLLDELVTMSSSKYTEESIVLELDRVSKKINKGHISIKKLKESMQDSRYFDASSQMIDKNIEISLVKKINRIKKDLAELKDEIDKKTEEEKKNRELCEEIEKEIETLDSLVKTLGSKKTTSEETKKLYEELLVDYEKKKEEKEQELVDARKTHEEINEKLNELSQAREDLEAKEKSESERLSDIRKELSDDNNYYDNASKAEDEEMYKELESDLSHLEEEKRELLSNPANISNDIKKMLDNAPKEKILEKIDELINAVKQTPYINETSKDALDKEEIKIRSEIVNATKVTEPLADVEEIDCIGSRTQLLNMLSKFYVTQKQRLDEIIKYIDSNAVNSIKREIECSEKAKAELTDKLAKLEEELGESQDIELLANKSILEKL